MRKRRQSGQVPSEPAGTAGARAEVLVLDDYLDSAELVGRVVTLLGHKPIVCTSPKDALQQVEQHHFDLIVADFHMPEIDGAQFYRLVVERHPELSNRVVFITGDSYGDEVNRFFSTTHLPHLEKPCSITTLREILHERLPELAGA